MRERWRSAVWNGCARGHQRQRVRPDVRRAHCVLRQRLRAERCFGPHVLRVWAARLRFERGHSLLELAGQHSPGRAQRVPRREPCRAGVRRERDASVCDEHHVPQGWHAHTRRPLQDARRGRRRLRARRGLRRAPAERGCVGCVPGEAPRLVGQPGWPQQLAHCAQRPQPAARDASGAPGRAAGGGERGRAAAARHGHGAGRPHRGWRRFGRPPRGDARRPAPAGLGRRQVVDRAHRARRWRAGPARSSVQPLLAVCAGRAAPAQPEPARAGRG